ncbi:hypothetical protein RUM44_010232 [Polyplax serrata]|uniref:WD repeat-containing protein 36 n=1 Tax=Polyplax serrata TaxID=468196 RepID=A0ABR1AV97_POLSC
MTSSSKVFLRYRVLGYVSNHIPVVTRYIKRRREHLFVTSVGKSFHTYSESQLALLTVSDLHPEDISCMAGDSYMIYTGAGKKIYAWRRGTELKHEYEGHEHPIKLLLPFGPHLISIDQNSHLKLWNIKTTEIQLELDFNNNNFEISAIMHPSTYLNKILLGSEQGALQLWNLNTSKLIYTFKGWNSGVNVLEQAPTVDVVGIGLKNGRIILHNLKFDETLMEFKQDWGIVTSLTFRLDETPLMITGTMYGHIIVWDLEERKIFSQLESAHDEAVMGMQCLQGMPMMITSSSDNSLKLWAFDMPDGGPRLLAKREGHSLPPTFIRFHGSNGHNILSAGGDSHLRIFNTLTEKFNKSLGKASWNRKKSKKKGRLEIDTYKMPPIVKFTSDTTREKEWDNIGAIHLGTTEVTTWSYDKLKMGELKLAHDRFTPAGDENGHKYKAHPVSVHLTHCGNFIMIGYTSGHCDRFNIQSGIHRATYGSDKAHDGPVRGITTDVLNKVVITGGADKLVKWWKFREEDSRQEIHKLELSDAVSLFASHDESSLTAVALENFSIILIDNDGRDVIRIFEGHTGRLMDLAFSPDSRWLITSAMDCCVFTWDIPSGCLIDHFKVDAPCTSLAFSPTGEFLATTHVEYLGVFLWANRTLYEHVTLKPIKNLNKIPLLALPSVATEVVEPEVEEEADEDVESIEQIDGLITLSELPSSRWQNLLNIDLIKKRNKPKEALQVSKSAPFFLPTLPGMDITFDLSGVEKIKEGSKIVSVADWNSLTAFATLLKDAEETAEGFRQVFEKLKCMGPSMIDHEINSLGSADEDLVTRLLSQFMKMIKFAMESKFDYELAQAYFGLFLKVHGETITKSDELLNQLEILNEVQNAGWHTLANNLYYNLSIIKALKL